MTLSMKLGGAWKEAQSLHVKINGEWKDVSTLYSKKDGAWVTVYSSGALIEFADYPFPIPVAQGWKYSTDKVNWITVSADGEINTSGTFTGFVKANSITLNEYYNETDFAPEILEYGVRMDGEPLSGAREDTTAFTNNSMGYVCGGRGSGGGDTVDVYDSLGVRATGTSLSVARSEMTSFSNGEKGYVCGGYSDTSSTGTHSTVDIYDKYGNRSNGNSLSVARWALTSFVNSNIAYVCGGVKESRNKGTKYSTVDIYDVNGNRSTGSSMSVQRSELSSFVNSSYGFVCGGQTGVGDSVLTAIVDKYDSSGSRTSAASLSEGRLSPSCFVLNNKGYVGGGGSSSMDVFDSSGNRSTGTPLSFSRYGSATFVLSNRGYVCGTWDRNGMDVYDIYGNRTTGNALSVRRGDSSTFVNSNRAYVCGGFGSTQSAVVDIYYDEYKPIYSTKLPITEGSTYTLNGESGVADVSKVMEFNSKVSGTIKYKKGDLLPGVKVTVVDEDGNVVEGATISIISSDWDLSNMTATYTWYSYKGESIITLTLGGIIGSFPECAKLKVVFVQGNKTYPYDPDGNEFVTIGDNNPNITLRDWGLSNINGHFPDSVKVTLYDANDKVIGEGTASCVDVT